MLRQPKLDSIGAHVYGGTYNSASVIGRYGNPYNDYLRGFDVQLVNEGLNIIPLRATGAAPFSIEYASTKANEGQIADGSGYQTPTGRRVQNQYQTPLGTPRTLAPLPSRSKGIRMHNSAESLEEGFMDILKGALRVGAPLLGGALKTGLPIAMGPLGAPIGALAGFALNAAGKLAESAEAESFDPSEAHEGTMERAILAEAALTAIQTMDLHPDDQESIFSDMKDYVMKAAPTIKKVAPRVMGAMMEPALRIAMNSLHNYNQRSGSGTEAFEDQSGEPFRLNITYSSKIDQKGDARQDAFVRGLQNSLKQGQEALDPESEEGFFDIVKAGVSYVGKGVIAGARVGLPILAQMMGDSAESIEAESAAPAALSSQDLAKRALVGEAALQALMKLPPQTLEEEGFFDTIMGVVKTIAPVVVKVAPTVISNLSPTIGGLIKAATGQEAAFATTTTPALHPRSLNTKRSISRLRKRPSGNNLLTKVQDWDGYRAY